MSAKFPRDYSEEDLRRMLIGRYQTQRRMRLEHYRRTGRFSPQDPFLERSRESDKLKSNGNQSVRKWLNPLELGAFIMIAILIISLFQSIYRLNRITPQTWIFPEFTPTPLVQSVPLPSSRAEPRNPANAYQPSVNVHGLSSPLEIKDFIKVVSMPPAEFATRIQIPAIDVDAPIVLGVEWEQLKKGVGQVLGSATPGQKGNLVLSAHNDIYGELFRYLDRLEPGDRILVFTNIKAYEYVVTNSEIVEPTRVDVIAQTPDATATLISCYPYLIDNMRIIVKARLVES